MLKTGTGLATNSECQGIIIGQIRVTLAALEAIATGDSFWCNVGITINGAVGVPAVGTKVIAAIRVSNKLIVCVGTGGGSVPAAKVVRAEATDTLRVLDGRCGTAGRVQCVQGG